MSDYQRIGILGAGAWGTALAQVCAGNGLDVTLWMRASADAEIINTTRSNEKHLPGVTLSERITATSDLSQVAQQDLLIVTIPTQFIAKILEKARPAIASHVPILVASKGVEISSGRLVSQIVRGVLPDHPVGILTGPSFAIEVANNLPAALTLAFPDDLQDLNYRLCEVLSTPHFRLYASDDVVGAQLGGAIKNVIAIACGISTGKRMGDNARAALLTRGLAEMVRLGVAMGAEPQTFLGLSGLGDLTLTCNAMQSRNFSLGVAIGQGQRAADILSARDSVAEGYYTADAVVKLAEKYNVDMPICQAVHETLHKEKAIDQVIRKLLERPVGMEKPKSRKVAS